MNLYLHYTRQPNPGDDADLGPVSTYATGHFEKNWKGEILLAIDGNMRTTDRLGTDGLAGLSVLDALRDSDGCLTRLEATGINSDEDEALFSEARAQGWRVVDASDWQG